MTNADGGARPSDDQGSQPPPTPAYAQPSQPDYQPPPQSQYYPPPGTPPSPAYYPQPGYPQSGYPQPGVNPPPGYQSPGYPPPGYQAPGGYPAPGAGHASAGGAPPYQGYPPPSGYAGYPGYPPLAGPPMALKPGVIPLRPLTLGEIFNGAVAYIRANPKASLGLTAVVVIIAQLISLLLQIGPLTLTSQVGAMGGANVSDAALVGSSLGSIAGLVAVGLSAILLSGMLTVVVGRAVFGTPIKVGEAWAKVKDRLLALIGMAALELAGAALLVGVVVAVIVAVALAANGGAAALVGIPLVIGLIVALVYLGTMLTFAPVLIVLERLPVMQAIARSFALVRGAFWRVFGIRLLGQVVSGFVAGAVAVPFAIASQVLMLAGSGAVAVILGIVLNSVGSTIGQIITAPFNAGVVVLLYTDRRIRAEAFDLVLQTGAAGQAGAPADSTDHLWLTGQP